MIESLNDHFIREYFAIFLQMSRIITTLKISSGKVLSFIVQGGTTKSRKRNFPVVIFKNISRIHVFRDFIIGPNVVLRFDKERKKKRKKKRKNARESRKPWEKCACEGY